MSSRPTLGLIYLVQGLRQLGEDPEPILQRHGLRADQLNPATRIDRQLEQRIYADLARQVHDPLIGLKLGSFYGLAGYGSLVMLLMTCESVHEALQTGIRYQRLTYLYGKLSWQPGDPMSAMVLEPVTTGLDERAARLRIDGEVSGTFKMVNDWRTGMGLDLHMQALDMPYARPPEASSYEQHFGCPVRFGHRQARFWIRNDALRQRLPTADAAAHALYRQRCDEELLALQPSSPGWTARVLELLSLYQSHYPQAAELAKALDVSERSLRRALQQEGSSYRELLAQARFAKAQHLLRHSQLSVDAIAQQLGYAESAAFIHAFQRWSGVSPGSFRER